MSRVICWFSCGAASAVATKLALAQYGALNTVVVRCIVKEEHPDNDRFAADCEDWFGVPVFNITAKEYGGSVIKVCDVRQYWSGIEGAPCTRLLKRLPREQFQEPTDKHIFGYTADAKDLDRWDDFLDANNIDAVAPLIERGVQHKDCLSMVESAGIELPVMYRLGFKHNNCIGCRKAGGQGYWNKVRIHFPAVFEQACEQSRRIGAKPLMVNGVHKYLDELTPGAGDYDSEPEIQCGVFCEMAKQEYSA
jgi:hypothetical protein